MKNSEYLNFSNHLGHGLTENKRQNLYTFGERTRAAQPGLLGLSKMGQNLFAMKKSKMIPILSFKAICRALKQALIYYDWAYSLTTSAHKSSCLRTIADYHIQS